MSQTRVRAVATGSALGAEVIGVDLRDLHADNFPAFLRPGWITRYSCFVVELSATIS